MAPLTNPWQWRNPVGVLVRGGEVLVKAPILSEIEINEGCRRLDPLESIGLEKGSLGMTKNIISIRIE